MGNQEEGVDIKRKEISVMQSKGKPCLMLLRKWRVHAKRKGGGVVHEGPRGKSRGILGKEAQRAFI